VMWVLANEETQTAMSLDIRTQYTSLNKLVFFMLSVTDQKKIFDCSE